MLEVAATKEASKLRMKFSLPLFVFLCDSIEEQFQLLVMLLSALMVSLRDSQPLDEGWCRELQTEMSLQFGHHAEQLANPGAA